MVRSEDWRTDKHENRNRHQTTTRVYGRNSTKRRSSVHRRLDKSPKVGVGGLMDMISSLFLSSVMVGMCSFMSMASFYDYVHIRKRRFLFLMGAGITLTAYGICTVVL